VTVKTIISKKKFYISNNAVYLIFAH